MLGNVPSVEGCELQEVVKVRVREPRDAAGITSVVTPIPRRVRRVQRVHAGGRAA